MWLINSSILKEKWEQCRVLSNQIFVSIFCFHPWARNIFEFWTSTLIWTNSETSYFSIWLQKFINLKNTFKNFDVDMGPDEDFQEWSPFLLFTKLLWAAWKNMYRRIDVKSPLLSPHLFSQIWLKVACCARSPHPLFQPKFLRFSPL